MKLSSVLFLLLLFPLHSTEASCNECAQNPKEEDANKSVPLKLIALGSILSAGAAGVLIPVAGRSIPFLRPENDIFFAIKSFAAGVILSTALIHVLPGAFSRLSSPCLPAQPWNSFPFAGFVSMLTAIGTMMLDSFATGYYRRSHFRKALPVDDDSGSLGGNDVETAHAGHVHGHAYVSHGHVDGPAAGGRSSPVEGSMADKIRHRIISQVLELGIVVHSVIIGISLGASGSAKTIKPLVGALSFHQFFEGIGLGGCIIQARFRVRTTVIMAVFFSLTAPFGIGLGIAISSVYDHAHSSAALIVEGIFDAASAGILVYMSLVDLLAADFTNPRMQNNIRLQLAAHLTLLLGSGFMSLLAIWA